MSLLRSVRPVVIFLTCLVVLFTLIFILKSTHSGLSTHEYYVTASNLSSPVYSSLGHGKVILTWTKWFKKPWTSILKSVGAIECGPHRYKCFITDDRTLFLNSSAVIFHEPARQFFYDLHIARSMKRPPGQYWIFYNREAPGQHSQRESLIKRQCNSLFNWTMTYKLSSDIRFGYAEVVPGIFQGGYDPNKNYLKGRTKMAIALISSCVSHRLRFIDQLKKYIDVDVYGYCGKSCEPNCFSLIPNYKFYLSFENSFCKDYITEKTFVNAFTNEIVPVIISGANLSNPTVIPPNSFINALKFRRAIDLADYLLLIGSDPERYNKFFKWRDNWSVTEIKFFDMPCYVCKKLYEPNLTFKVYTDIASWYSVNENCKPYPTLR